MGISTHQGRKFYVYETAQATDMSQGDFESVPSPSWVLINNIVTPPDIVIEQSFIDTDFIDETGIASTLKGAQTGSESDFEIGFDSADAGHVAIETMANTKFTYAFKSELNDIASGGSTNTIQYGRAMLGVPSFPSGGKDDFVSMVIKFKLQQKLALVRAT